MRNQQPRRTCAPRRVPRATDRREEMLAPDDAAKRFAHEQRMQRFWQWFAVVTLIACWIAEASMCAARGF